MFDLERVANGLTNNLLKDVQLDTVQRAKVEYGLSLLLGVATELILTVGVSLFFGTAIYTLLIMLSALSLRIFTGGAHCSSFRRCSVFTLVVFSGMSFLVKAMLINMEFREVMWVSVILVLVTLPSIWKPKRFTLVVWVICASLPFWSLFSSSEASWLIQVALSMAAGLVLQGFMLNRIGQKVVMRSDSMMQRLGI